MPVIIALVGRAERARLHAALRDVATVRFCDSVAALGALAGAGGIEAAIAEPRDACGAPTLPAIRLLRERYPSIAVLLYVPLTPAGMHAVAEAAALGVSGVVVRDYDDHGEPLRATVAAARHAGVAEEIVRAIEPAVPRALLPFVRICATEAARPVAVRDVAAAAGVHRRTLVNRLRAAGLPPPSTIIGWSRLLHAARLLDDPGRPLERVAAELGFPSRAALQNMVHRYARTTPSALRAAGAFREMLAAFARAMGVVRDCEEGPPSG